MIKLLLCTLPVDLLSVTATDEINMVDWYDMDTSTTVTNNIWVKEEDDHYSYYEIDEFQAESINCLLHIHSTIPLIPGIKVCYFIIKQPKPKSRLRAKLYK